VRIKDVAGIQGARNNQLTGFGLVIGLEGTGDSNQALFTPQAIANMLQRYNLSIPAGGIKIRNVASVLITATLPPFAKPGSQIDVTVSSMGDARSLQGGTLVQTALVGADGKTYAVAQGAISIGGFNFSAGGSGTQKNHVAAGRLPKGAIVEREVAMSLTDGNTLDLTLKEPDFTTANRIAEAVNLKLPEASATAIDPYTVRVNLTAAGKQNLISFISQIEGLPITPDTSAKIILNERTGTIVIGGDVRIQPCAIAHGSLQIKVENTPVIAIPAPFSGNGQPVILPQKEVTVKEGRPKLAAIPATTTVDQLVKALNSLGVTPREMITIIQTMRQGGWITAEIEIQ
jgi:flagellar P-ring protein precursor FlgI